MSRTGPAKPNPTGPKSHITRYSDSSFYDEVCVLCGETDSSGGRLEGSCWVGRGFSGTHELEHTHRQGKTQNQLDVRCKNCDASTKIGFTATCYEVLPEVPVGEIPQCAPDEIQTVTLDHETMQVTVDVEKILTPTTPFRFLKHPVVPLEEIRADRSSASFIVTEMSYEFYTPYGTLSATGPKEAAEYVADLIADDTAHDSVERIKRRVEATARLSEYSALFDDILFADSDEPTFTYKRTTDAPVS